MSAKLIKTTASPVGRLLQNWRRVRRKSQLDLALEADVSQRHVSFVESGRTNPSREMILVLASALDVPLRERNTLLVAAGYAPLYHETVWGAPEMTQARKALEFILKQQEPYPAVVMDRHWNLLMTNRAAPRFFGLFVAPPEDGPANILRQMFDPQRLRPFIANWESVAEALIQRVHREAVGGVPDDGTVKLIEELLSYPGVPLRWRTPDLNSVTMPFLPVKFKKDDLEMNFFSTVTTLGTPQDITLQEIRIECFFPADEMTERRARKIATA
jgi:transcriptional regulator with XRE-family HTH domain